MRMLMWMLLVVVSAVVSAGLRCVLCLRCMRTKRFLLLHWRSQRLLRTCLCWALAAGSKAVSWQAPLQMVLLHLTGPMRVRLVMPVLQAVALAPLCAQGAPCSAPTAMSSFQMRMLCSFMLPREPAVLLRLESRLLMS